MLSARLTLAAPHRRSLSTAASVRDIQSPPFHPATHRPPPCLALVRTSGSAPAPETIDCRIAPPSRSQGPAPSPAGTLPATLPRSAPAGDNPPPPLLPAGIARCAPADILAVCTRSLLHACEPSSASSS